MRKGRVQYRSKLGFDPLLLVSELSPADSAGDVLMQQSADKTVSRIQSSLQYSTEFKHWWVGWAMEWNNRMNFNRFYDVYYTESMFFFASHYLYRSSGHLSFRRASLSNNYHYYY